MPSAARQRLPVDLWYQGHRKPLCGSPVPFYHTHEIQANPGHCDVLLEDKQHNFQGGKIHLSKLRRGSPKSVTRSRVNTPIIGVSDSENSSVIGGMDTVKLSSSAKSDSYLNYTPSIVLCNAYAMESTFAPHPSEVPFPPLKWLQSTSKRSLVISDISLKTILGFHVVA